MCKGHQFLFGSAKKMTSETETLFVFFFRGKIMTRTIPNGGLRKGFPSANRPKSILSRVDHRLNFF